MEDVQRIWVTTNEHTGEPQMFLSRKEARQEASRWRLSGHKAKVYQVPVMDVQLDQGP